MSDRSVAAALVKIVRRLTRYLRFYGTYEYRIVQQNGDLLDLQAVAKKIGMPDSLRTPMRPGVPGCKGKPQPGSFVLVRFVNGDPARAYVAEFVGNDDGAFLPLEVSIDASAKVTAGNAASPVNLGGAFAAVLRSGERVSITGLLASGSPVTAAPGGTFIALDPTVVVPGAPPGGFSQVKA